MKAELKLELSVKVELDLEHNALYVYKRDADLFHLFIEQLGIAAQHNRVVGEPKDSFIFVQDGQAAYIFNAYKEW